LALGTAAVNNGGRRIRGNISDSPIIRVRLRQKVADMLQAACPAVQTAQISNAAGQANGGTLNELPGCLTKREHRTDAKPKCLIISI
jgi:hypothetical protein